MRKLAKGNGAAPVPHHGIHDIMMGTVGFHVHDGVTFEVLVVGPPSRGRLAVRMTSAPPPRHPLHGIPVDPKLWISHCCVNRDADCTVVVGERSEFQVRLWHYLNQEVKKFEKAKHPEHHATRFTQDLGSIASLDTIFGRVEPEEDGALDPA